MFRAELFITDHNSLDSDLAKLREEGARVVVLNADGNLAVCAVMGPPIEQLTQRPTPQQQPTPAVPRTSEVRVKSSKQQEQQAQEEQGA